MVDTTEENVLLVDEMKVEEQFLGNYILNELLNELTERQQKIIMLYYLYGYTDLDIAKKFAVTQQSICKSRNSALKKIRKKGAKIWR